jgi:hypothetical protein
MADWLEYCRVSREENRIKHAEFYERMKKRNEERLAKKRKRFGE